MTLLLALSPVATPKEGATGTANADQIENALRDLGANWEKHRSILATSSYFGPGSCVVPESFMASQSNWQHVLLAPGVDSTSVSLLDKAWHECSSAGASSSGSC